MAKFKIVPFLLRFTAVIAVIGYPLSSQVIAEQTSWDNVFNLFLFPNNENEEPESQPGGSRGEIVCSLAPFDQEGESNILSEIWNNRPIFVWKGTVERIELYSEPGGNLIWKQIVEPGKNHISYTGEPLKSGETYKLYLYNIPNPEPSYPADVDLVFKVVEAGKYERIAQELNQLETQFQQKQATPEEISLARAQYFAEQQLWSDVIMESVLVENPPSSLAELLKTKIPEHLCS